MSKEPDEPKPEYYYNERIGVGQRLLRSAVEPVDPELMKEILERFPNVGCVFLRRVKKDETPQTP